jgi:hypothetical protein
MRTEVEVFNFEYTGDKSAVTDWNVYLSSDLFARLMRGDEESQRWIARIGDAEVVQVSCGIGAPLEYESTHRIYAPQWILDTLGINGDGELLMLECVPCENLPRATRLVLRPSEEMIAEPRELLEGPLSLLGAVREGSVLPLPGGLGTLTVEVTEPAEEVFLDGAEVAVEFKEDHLRPASVADVPPAPRPATEDKEKEEEQKGGFGSMLPSSFDGAALAAARAARAKENRRKGLPAGFEAFSGAGYSLKP